MFRSGTEDVGCGKKDGCNANEILRKYGTQWRSQQPQVGGRQRVRLQLVATERTLLIYVARNCALAIVD